MASCIGSHRGSSSGSLQRLDEAIRERVGGKTETFGKPPAGAEFGQIILHAYYTARIPK